MKSTQSADVSDPSAPAISPEEQSTAVSNISGGVEVDAEQVTIAGDVVGRDKVTQNTWTSIRQIVLQPWAWIGGAVILVVGLIVVAGLFNIAPIRSLLPTPAPSPTPLAFAPANPDQSLIVVTDFADRSGGTTAGLDPDQYVFDALQDRIARDQLDVRVQHLHEAVDDATARSVGQVYSATLVLWGWYDAVGISPRLERITLRSAYHSMAEGRPLYLAEPGRVQFDVVANLQAQAAYFALFTLGVDRYAGALYDQALPYFDSALAALPSAPATSTQHAEVYFFRGNTYAHLADFARARADYSRTLELQPDNVLALNNRAIAADMLGEHEQALADYDRAIDLPAAGPDQYLNRGLCHMNLEQIPEALDDFDQALDLHPDYAAAYVARATANALHLGDFERAIADYTRAIDLEPDLGIAYAGRALAYQLKGEHAGAQADLDKARRLGADTTADNDFARGGMYFVEADYDQAIVSFERFVKRTPRNAVAHYWLGQAYKSRADKFYLSGAALKEKIDDQTLSDYDQAIANFTAALKYSPDFVDALYARGAVYLTRLDADAALADYNRVLEIKPDYVMAYIGRSNVYLGRNDTDRAIADLKKALELTKDNPLMQQQIKGLLQIVAE